MGKIVRATIFLILALSATAVAAQQSTAKPHQMFEVRIADHIIDRDTGQELTGPFSGRLVISAVALPPGTKHTTQLPRSREDADQERVFMNLMHGIREPR